MSGLEKQCSLRILYFGSSGVLSTNPLIALLNTSHEIVSVVVNEPFLKVDKLAVVALEQQNTVQEIAFQNNVPIIRLTGGFSRTDFIRVSMSGTGSGIDYGSGINSGFGEATTPPIDIIISSCFSRKIPEYILSLARLGAINIHPSMLPAYRGPDPIFWQLRDAAVISGVSLHLMSESFDAGPIIAQQSIVLNESTTIAEVNQILAKLAAQLVLESLDDVRNRISQARVQNIE